MIELYVLNKNLERVDVIDSYTSLIWANRYNDVGDCELYVEASEKNLKSLKKGNYLIRDDDDMVCRIKKVQLDTDSETGNYLIISAYDVKDILKQRIIWGQVNVDGNVEEYIRKILYDNLVNPSFSARQIKDESGRPNFFLGNAVGFSEVTTEQSSYKNVEEKIKELCKKYNWGYKVRIDEDLKNFYFLLYKGTDRSEYIIFSPDFENIVSTKYIENGSNLANVALVGGEGEGSERSKNISGYAESLDRYELFVDAKDISKTITWSDLIELYPTKEQGGYGYLEESDEGKINYKMEKIDIIIVDTNQLSDLQNNYPEGELIIKNDIQYYQISNVTIADLPNTTAIEQLENGDDVILRDLVYSVFLLNRGYEKLSEYEATKTFEGTVEPNTTFKYKEDYFLGDIVNVTNEFGITADARIVEVVEVYDENGYSIEPKFKYMEE